MRFGTVSLLASIVAAQSCHDLILPWGVYPGVLEPDKTVCKYSDVRFGSAPVGSLRFAAPEYPPATVNGTVPKAPGPNMSCVQMNATSCVLGGPIGASDPSCFPPKYGTQNEDCLFLDIYVPTIASSSKTPLPVVIWIYGGGYTGGSKTQFDPKFVPFYSGDGPVTQATTFNKKETSVIFVAGNYRLGPYGWLAGTYMEQNAQPNAGLLDQRAVMDFVQDHIHLVKGDPNHVSVWGESAGASSIMHHLAMPLNIENPPPFKKAILQSPAYEWMWDQRGDLNDSFTDFARLVAGKSNCASADITCLRNASSEVLASVSQIFAEREACTGIMPFGPSVDDNLIPQLAPYRYQKGQVAKIDSIVVSHVDLEVPYAGCTSSFSFIPKPIRCNPESEQATDDFLNEVFTGVQYAGVRQRVKDKYPSKNFSDQIARAAAMITDLSFTCNTRFIINQYLSQQIPVYAMDYAIGRTFDGTVYNASVHGSDLLPLFSTLQTSYVKTIMCLGAAGGMTELKAILIDEDMRRIISPTMQQLFTNAAIGDDINARNPISGGHKWERAYVAPCPGTAPDQNQSCVWNLMAPSIPRFGVGSYWSNSTGPDLYTPDSTCGFWQDIVDDVTGIAGQATATAATTDTSMVVDEETSEGSGGAQYVFGDEL